MWNGKFELPDRMYFASDIQDYFEHILRMHGEKTDNPSMRICKNKIDNRIAFKITTRCYLKLLMPEITLKH